MEGEQPARKRRKAERPGEILEAAFEEFAHQGYAATRLDDIAARVGITKAAIYLYFPSKEQLFLAMVREFIRPLSAEMGELVAAHLSAPEFLRAYLRFAYRAMTSDRRGRELLRILIAEAARFPHLVEEYQRELQGPALEQLRALLRQGVERGELRPSPVVDHPDIVIAPVLNLNVRMMLFADRHPIDVERYLEAHIDLILNGLLPERASASTGAGPKNCRRQRRSDGI